MSSTSWQCTNCLFSSVQCWRWEWAFTWAGSTTNDMYRTTNVVDNAAYHSAGSFRSIPSVMADEQKCWAVRRLSQETCWPIEKSLFCLPHPPLRPPLRGNQNPLEFVDETYPKKLEDGATVWWKLHDPSFNRFWLIHPCDGQMDGQTDRQTELPWHICAIAMLSRVKIGYCRQITYCISKMVQDKCIIFY